MQIDVIEFILLSEMFLGESKQLREEMRTQFGMLCKGQRGHLEPITGAERQQQMRKIKENKGKQYPALGGFQQERH